MNKQKKTRPISEIALEIQADWSKKKSGVSPFAKPYLTAMLRLTNVSDRYLFDDGRTIISYFLSNAGSWRGDKAKQIKAELRELIK